MSKIEWVQNPDGTRGETWNLWHGCTKISPGCKHCYAERFAKRLGSCKKYDGTIKYFPERNNQPLHWKKPRMIFVNSMSDLFHESLSFETIFTISAIISIMSATPRHVYQILTKRPEQALFYNFPSNVWLGVSVESLEYLPRIETLLKIPTTVRFVSFEPLLSDVGDISEYLPHEIRLAFPDYERSRLDGIDWVIVGCESGPNRRPCKLEWVRNIVAQCKNAHVPVFVKQLSLNGKVEHNVERFPADLQIREFPKQG